MNSYRVELELNDAHTSKGGNYLRIRLSKSVESGYRFVKTLKLFSKVLSNQQEENLNPKPFIFISAASFPCPASIRAKRGDA